MFLQDSSSYGGIVLFCTDEGDLGMRRVFCECRNLGKVVLFGFFACAFLSAQTAVLSSFRSQFYVFVSIIGIFCRSDDEMREVLSVLLNFRR